MDTGRYATVDTYIETSIPEYSCIDTDTGMHIHVDTGVYSGTVLHTCVYTRV